MSRHILTSGTFSSPISNTLSLCVSNGYTLDIEPNNYLLLTAEKFESYRPGHCVVYGNCLTDSNRTEKVWVNVEQQPKETVVEIFSKLRHDGIDGLYTDCFERVFNKLIQNTKINNPGSHLKHQIDDIVQYKDLRSYGDDVKEPEATTYKILDVLPNDSFADLSVEYEIQNTLDSNDIKLARAACLRSEDWKESDYNEFNTGYNDLIEFNGITSVMAGNDRYVLTFPSNLPEYLNINSPYYGSKKQYLQDHLFYERNDGSVASFKLLFGKLISSKLETIISNAVETLKTNENNLPHRFNNNSASALLRYGTTLEICEMDWICQKLPDPSESDNNIDQEDVFELYRSGAKMWIVFKNIHQLHSLTDIATHRLERKLPGGMTAKLLLDDEHPLQFVWIKKSKVFGLENYFTQSS